MQKFRVYCPHCEASLLVTEDLLGQPGNCPGCHQDFQLPAIESFARSTSGIVERPAETTSSPVLDQTSTSSETPPPATGPEPPLFSPPTTRHSTQKPVKIEGRPALRIISQLFKVLAMIQMLAGCMILLVMLVAAVRSAPTPQTVFITIGIAVSVALSSLPTLACSELILVFIAQEEMLRHILNQLRSREKVPSE